MANRKISDLTALTAPATGDLLPIVDISEAAAADKNKKITFGELFASIPAGTAAAPSVAFEGDSNTGIYSPGADQVAIATGGTGRLFVDASGRVGIGTSPSYTLEAAGAIATQSTSPAIHLNDSTPGGGSFALLNGGAIYSYGQIALRDTTNSQTAYTYSAGASGFHNWFIAGTEKVRLDPSGRILVGTSSDSGGALLQVNGDRIRIGTAKTPASATATGTTGEIAWDANYIYVCTATNTWKRTAISTW